MLQLSILTFLVTLPSLNFGQSQRARPPNSSAGISQLVENRAARVSCWGLIINLENSRFKKIINQEQLEIREAKHNRDLRETMTWRVQQTGKTLIIKFKPGKGDFGTGNRVEIRIYRSAFVEPIKSGNDYLQWVIDTDMQSIGEKDANKTDSLSVVLMLFEEGGFPLSDPILRWAPEFSRMRVLHSPTGPLDRTDPAERPITFEDLLTHGSGVTRAGRGSIRLGQHERQPMVHCSTAR